MAVRPVPAVDRPTARADEACAALYRRHGSEILRYCRRRLREPADAEDVAQQVFVRAYGALLRGERVRLPRHWLLRIARNECRRFVSRRGHVQEVGFDETIDVPPEEEQPRWSPAEIRRALDELVPTQRQALVMRELEGRPYAEIARDLRLSVSAVETLLFRARRSLREQLDGAIECGAAERALSLELDGRLPETEKSGLRAHLRGCADCRRLARRSRARRQALRTLLPFPLQQGQLASVVGGGGAAAGGAALGTGAVAKAVALLVAAGAVSAGTGVTAARTLHDLSTARTPAAASMEDPGTPTLQAQAVVAPPSLGGTTPAAESPATSGAGTSPVTAAAPATVTSPGTPSIATMSVEAAPAGATDAPPPQEPLAAAASTVEKTVDAVVPALPVPKIELPPVQPPALPVKPPALPVQPPTLPVQPPPLPTVPGLPPIDPDLPDLPG